jgi:Predicted membrane protein
MVQARPDLLHSDISSVVYSAPTAVVAGPLYLSTQYHAQDGYGQYTYGYSGVQSAKAESKTADGITRGGYSYIDSNGIIQSASYVSDPVNGFRVAATNLPAQVSTQVTDTPEVAAAKASHAVAFNEAAAVAAAAPDSPEAHVVPATAVPPAPEASAAPAVASAPEASATPAIPTASEVPATPAEPAAPASLAADGPTVVATHTYTAPGIVASANTAGSFSYSAHSFGPTYSPAFYPAVLSAATPVLVNGLPTDTPEVAAAKAVHFAKHIEAKQLHYF